MSVREVAERIEWLPIESAPKTGEHILAAVFDERGIGLGVCGDPPRPQSWQGVVHWWDYDEPGWYLSTANGDIKVTPTHFRHLTELAAALRREAHTKAKVEEEGNGGE